MRRILWVVIAVATLAASSPCLAGGNPLIGTWADEKGENVYQFKQNGAFRHYLKLGETPPLPGTTASGRPVVSWSRTEGAYTAGKKICAVGKRRGNLLVLGEGFQICIQNRFAGTKLFFTEVYAHGEGGIGIVDNLMLERIYEMPRGIRED
jgi:hypothetical protein